MSWTVPGYAVERMLGFGSTGEVWVGRDLATGERVALKRLRPGSSDRESLRREAALLAAFRHPNVVALRGVLGAADGLVLVLDLAEGGSFAGLLAVRGRLPAAEVGELCAPLARALAAAHAEGLVHGDVAPGNLLLDARGRPLIADLGTARLAGDVAALSAGTPGYLDPAVLRGATPTAASDVYGLAAVALHLLTGARLRQERDDVEGALASAGLPDGVAGALATCLDAEPARRPTAEALAAVFDAAATEGDVLDEPASPAVRRAALATAGTRVIPRAVPADAEPAGWWRRTVEAARQCRGRHRQTSAALVTGTAAVGVMALLVVAAVVVPAAAAGLLVAPAEERRVPGPVSSASPIRSSAARPSSPAPVTAVRPGSPLGPESARAVVEALDRARSDAFARGDPRVLTRVYAPGSRAREADMRAVTRLGRGVRAVGVRHQVLVVRVVRQSSVRVRLLLTDRMPHYRVVDSRGAALRTVAPRGPRAFRVDLVAVSGAWRIAEISATAPSAAPRGGRRAGR